MYSADKSENTNLFNKKYLYNTILQFYGKQLITVVTSYLFRVFLDRYQIFHCNSSLFPLDIFHFSRTKFLFVNIINCRDWFCKTFDIDLILINFLYNFLNFAILTASPWVSHGSMVPV